MQEEESITTHDEQWENRKVWLFAFHSIDKLGGKPWITNVRSS